nr:hypothetical protein [Kibdelosporangium sp. MJ126-NF4]
MAGHRPRFPLNRHSECHAAHTLTARTRPARVGITSGAHEDAYWRRIMPEMLAFVGQRIA